MPAPQPQKKAWQAGQRIGRYTILGHLASGGMAEVFLARPTDDPTGRRLIALKRINEESSSDREFIAMFLDEARIGVQLTHPHLVRTYGIDRDGPCPYLALEYLSGESLQDIIEESAKRRRPIPPGHLARWIADAAAGLHHAHHVRGADGRPLDIVHRDISPHNLFVTYRGKVKVVDFGIAQATIKSSHTQTGYVKGKLAYLSPEQVKQLPLDGRTDVFALGIVLFEALTLSPLFPDEVSDSQIVQSLGGTHPLERVSDRQPRVSPSLDRIVARAMAMDAGERYPSAEALKVDLEAWMAEAGDAPSEDALGAFVRELFPERLKRKEAMVRASLGADAQRRPAMTDEATATDLDLISHPELLRLASQGGGGPAPAAPSRAPAPRAMPPQLDAAPATVVGPPPSRWSAARQLGGRVWLGIALLGLGTFALTVALGSCLGHRGP